MITLYLIFTGAWSDSASTAVKVVYTILACLEWLSLFFLYWCYRIKKRASWRTDLNYLQSLKVVGIFFIVELVTLVLLLASPFILLYSYVLWYGPATGGGW